MESLIFAVIAVQDLYKRNKVVVAETQTLEPLDLLSLRHVYRAALRSAKRSADRNDSHLAQAVS